jgi:hypothetical protein
MTFVWLGTILVPGQLVEFWSDMLVSFVAGVPPTSTLKAAVRCLHGPMTVPEATPIDTPALSPLVMGMVVAILCTGIHIMRTLNWEGTAVGPIAMLGYGIGTGPTGEGVRHTSGNPKSIPPICVFTNISILLSHMYAFCVDFYIFFGRQHGIFSPQRKEFINEIVQSTGS